MKWSDGGRLGFTILKTMFPAIGVVEASVKAIANKDTPGAVKQQAVMDAIMAGVGLGEQITEKDLLNDTQVQSAVRNAIDAVVAVQNAIEAARKAKVAAGAKPADPNVVPGATHPRATGGGSTGG